MNGNPAVVLSVLKQPGVDTLALTERIDDELDLIAEDEAKFMDRSTMQSIVADEYRIVSDPRPAEDAIKLVGTVRAASGNLSPEAFFSAYRDRVGGGVPGVPGLMGYEQNHCRLGFYKSGRVPDFDAMGMLWFADEAALQLAFGSDEMRVVNAIEFEIFDFAQTRAALVREHRVIA